MNQEEKKYYQRQLILPEIGEEGQRKLKSAKVLVIGAGGLGCPVLEYLVRAGVGTIGITDGDKVSVSNLHRQSLYKVTDEGESKVFTASKHLLEVNPLINVMVHPQMIRPANALKMIDGYDIIVDCTDNYATRYLVNDACVLAGKSLVYGAIYRFEGQVSVFNYNNGPTYRCLFPDFPTDASNTNCAMSGVIGVLPGIIGLMQANEVLKMILGIGEVLSGKLMSFNALSVSSFTVKFSKNEVLDYQQFLKNGTLEHPFYIDLCRNEVDEISHDALMKQLAGNKDLVFVDVREREEEPRWESDCVIKIPLSELEKGVKSIPSDREVVVFCKSGIRSKKAIERLMEMGDFDRLVSLEGGMTEELMKIWIKKNQ